MVRSPLSFQDGSGRRELLDDIRKPPELNEHRQYVLEEVLGMSKEAIDRLERAGAIR